MLFPKTVYDEIKHPPKYDLRWLAAPVTACLIPSLFLLLFALTRNNQSLMDFLVFHVTTPFKHLLSRFWGLFPFGAAEVIWVAAILAGLAFLGRTVWLLITRGNRRRRLIRRGLAALAAGLIIYSCYTAMWGINYYARGFSQRSGLTTRGCSVEELSQLTAAFAAKCDELSDELPRNGEGITELETKPLFQNAAELYQGIQEEFPCLDYPVFDAKPMVFSLIISYTGFTGFYFPMTAESLVNVHQPDCLIPSTILHELAHQCNVAEEDAANFVAILAGLRCDDPVFQYSSALLGYIHLSNALYSADREQWKAVAGLLNEQVNADLDDNNAYWKQFESPVEKTSEKIYTGFLNSYGQTEGMKSYGQCVDLLVTYYFDYKWQ